MANETCAHISAIATVKQAKRRECAECVKIGGQWVQVEQQRMDAAIVVEGAHAICRKLREIRRGDAVVCGTAWVNETFRRLDPAIQITWHAQDCAAVKARTLLFEIEGPARAVLTGERTALNFLQTLSGTATAAQKYAVRCGGAQNHRMGLYDMFLVKENHIAAAGSLAAAVSAARRQSAGLRVEVEVESLEELEHAFAAEPDIIMLDDFAEAELVTAVARNRARAHAVKLEASGGVSLATVRRIAQTGVDYISIGALTKHVHAIDMSLRLDFAAPSAA